jgi:crossover junction endodeoxyribonuclease RusA
MEIEFFVPGVPAPKGSKRHVGGGRLIEASKKLEPWTHAIVQTVSLLDDFTPFDEPVEVWATYFLPRPKTVGRDFPSVPPDLDKLERGLFDALTKAGVWSDDALVVDSHPSKRYADDMPSGVLVRVCSVGTLI